MSKQWMLTLPLYVMIPRKTKEDRKVFINLNTYRNLHHHVNHQVKTMYGLIVKQQASIFVDNPTETIDMTFVLFKGSKRRIDRANMLCVAEKYACDALVECGFIPDDNDEYINSTKYLTGGVDKNNPRVELTIEEKPKRLLTKNNQLVYE